MPVPTRCLLATALPGSLLLARASAHEPDMFMSMDGNHDGYVTKDEMGAAHGAMSPGHGMDKDIDGDKDKDGH